ncbi:ATP-binding cassette domain-containing protein [Sulfurimonas sp.]|jgi:molybdate transport system ATP-binding protein|uniref:ABC transporter ATP-binding protein n=1 Tax=Sulfurimonas sp. TaxID=2022749 RepID=UPI0025D0E6AF|nr:ATP-binding cassette domain-containing protein [Sulfurimonas sp.]MCK9473954.1 ATP-binding cassette domain-containing protein [Sulfurimonas sp.]MDD3506633.1 ATP-binding cassette domain-containing protein [Sulfurimonas sp.]
MITINIQKALYGSSAEMNLQVDLNIAQNDFVALAGQSGSGKTTLLRILAGLEDSRGVIQVGDEIWQDSDKKIHLAPQKRKIGFVFQDYALFSNMSVKDNLLYVKKDKALASHLLEITGLTSFKNRFPNTLSGGQKQRVSLCRAMMNSPKLLLMDEPLSALDPQMRTKLQNEILSLHKEFATTTIMVSHDPSEIYRLANRAVVLNLGQIINDGTPKEILLQTSGSAKFSFEGELLDIIKVDVIHVAVIAIAQQIVEVVVSEEEVGTLSIGQTVRVGTKAFSPIISG